MCRLGNCFGLAALEKLWLQGWNDGAGLGPRAFGPAVRARLHYAGFQFEQTHPYPWPGGIGLWKEGACGILALCLDL